MIPKLAVYLLKKYEGYSEKIYICPAGYKTIGYGHVIKADEEIPETVSSDLAEELLLKDIIISISAINRLINVKLNHNQLSSLISFTFNLGSGALERSTLRQKLNRGEYQNAANEFLKWIYAKEVKLLGLIMRRAEEREIFLTENF